MQLPGLSKAADVIAGFEGFRASPYLDKVGVPTIGYGTTRYPNGLPVAMANPSINIVQARAYLDNSIRETAKGLGNAITRAPGINQSAAMLSLAYNMGWPKIANSTLVCLFNAGDISGAAGQFILWDKEHVDGVLVEDPGLKARRKKETQLFITPDDSTEAVA